MKALHFIFAGIAIMAMASCGSKDAAATNDDAVKAEAVDPIETTAVAPAAGFEAGIVNVLDNAPALTPGMKPERLLVVDFNAVWCGPCRQVAPVFEEMAQKYSDKAYFVSVDVDKFGELMDSFNLGNSIPVVLFIKPDGSTEHYVGTQDLLPADKFEAVIEKNLK